jgi:hypothetical protein
LGLPGVGVEQERPNVGMYTLGPTILIAQRPYRLLGLPETRSLIFLIKNLPDQAEGYLDYLQPLVSRISNVLRKIA